MVTPRLRPTKRATKRFNPDVSPWAKGQTPASKLASACGRLQDTERGKSGRRKSGSSIQAPFITTTTSFMSLISSCLTTAEESPYCSFAIPESYVITI
jgi:hypothetical protein